VLLCFPDLAALACEQRSTDERERPMNTVTRVNAVACGLLLFGQGCVTDRNLAVKQAGTHGKAATMAEKTVGRQTRTGAAPVLREKDRVWINVPGFDTGRMASSVHGAQARILETIGEPLTYGQHICYDTLVQYRRVAAAWLKQVAGGFDGDTPEQLLAAADEYAKIPDVCLKDLKCPWDLALPPGRFDAWTSAMRQDQIQRLEAAREHDRAAVAAIEKSLATIQARPDAK
jgi:hypothetical protein